MFNTPASDASSVVAAAARGVDDVLRVPPEPASCLKFGLSLLPLLSAIVTCLACKTRETLTTGRALKQEFVIYSSESKCLT
jgi:hypothetical protein